ncbi:MAG: translesion error-prone DNA polymerase V autoproteolytic subunit [Bdellovibrionales bacterium]|nr:translesion error-prone DNA polymerase V autoproteolytic subunit [Bdellovibrionales bacterium]
MSRGGARAGAGRPKGQGKYKESTRPVRVPESLIEDVLDYIASRGHALPLFSSAVSAGLPSHADDHMELLDLQKHLVKRPEATFFVRVTGESMIKAGIHPDDILVVDRSIEPRHGKIVIAAIDGHLTVKRLHKEKGKTLLMPENDNYDPIALREGNDMVIWGVVTNVLHAV